VEEGRQGGGADACAVNRREVVCGMTSNPFGGYTPPVGNTTASLPRATKHRREPSPVQYSKV
jgi:hypothetical protein